MGFVKFKGIDDPVFVSKSPPSYHPRARFQGFKPNEETVYPAGYQLEPDRLPVIKDMRVIRDVAVVMRDGVKLYCDLFLPVTDVKVPVILNCCFGGKNYHDCPNWIMPGCTPGMTSGFEFAEGDDPVFWTANEYAVCNLDIRGVRRSEGYAKYFGTQDAEDNYDVIEWLAVQDWCSGRVTMGGNSWLAMTQWWTAALQPPHLTCICPWDGHGDMYRDEYMRGGIPHYCAPHSPLAFGDSYEEDLGVMMELHPLLDQYWEDKVADFTKVVCPVYQASSYTSYFHTNGNFDAWQRTSSKEKWLRTNNNFEWQDTRTHQQDMLKFLDYYMKDKKDNGWDKTPRVRMAVLDPGHENIIDRPETEWPPERMRYKTFYLHSDGVLNDGQQKSPACVSYISDDQKSYAAFTIQFEEDTEITGFIGVKLWVSTDDYDDMDIYVRTSKQNAAGEYLFTHPTPQNKTPGPEGMLRASMRELDTERSTPGKPYHTFKKCQKLGKGETVPVEINIWPASWMYHKGEKLELAISGFQYLGMRDPLVTGWGTDNHGKHVIHMGGEYDSQIRLPIVPIL